MHTYENDSDFHEAYKNLLRSSASMTKILNQCEPLNYGLHKVMYKYI